MENFQFLKNNKTLRGRLIFLNSFSFKAYFQEDPLGQFTLLYNKKSYLLSYKASVSIEKESGFYIEAFYSCPSPLYKIFLESLNYKELLHLMTKKKSFESFHELEFMNLSFLKRKLFNEFYLKTFYFSDLVLPLNFYVEDKIFKHHNSYLYCLKKKGFPFIGIQSKHNFEEIIPMLKTIFFLEKEFFPKRILGSQEEVILSFKRFFHSEDYQIVKKLFIPSSLPTLILEASEFSPPYPSNAFLQSSQHSSFSPLPSLEKRPLDLAFALKTSCFDLEKFVYFLQQKNLSLKDLEEEKVLKIA